MRKPGSIPADYFDTDARTSIRSIADLLDTGILSSKGSESPFFRPCITQILIELSDLLQKLDKNRKRICFKDDISQQDGGRDVTDLIRDCRNASCHISSGAHIFQQNKFVFNVMVGYCPAAMQINDVILGCDYADDIAIFWGSLKLYAGRHIVRAYREAIPHFPDPFSRR
ncbi:hypothetical protein [Sphingobium olei]|uniref:DZIP3-like HEPN domain-containing protein n=1 Tax=Sphingobium olei TaxID=420955 RepID=A0ABW3P4A7_9SPHN|nr:hypothetical protein [Sphingobium sp.]